MARAPLNAIAYIFCGNFKMINYPALQSAVEGFGKEGPFDHCVIDDFFLGDFARQLEEDFPQYHSDKWFFYNNPIEHKKALNNWELFPKATYAAFSELYSPRMMEVLSTALGQEVFADPGLNGGGWHIHGRGGNLNPHLDYSIHPKLGLERVLNIIIYLSSSLDPQHGGNLGMWANDPVANAPGVLVKEIEPRFNRAVLFNTTQNSWHGMSRGLAVPDDIYRKSLAIYYLREPSAGVDRRGRALFAPRDVQKDDPDVLETIRLRSNVATSANVYRSVSKGDISGEGGA